MGTVMKNGRKSTVVPIKVEDPDIFQRGTNFEKNQPAMSCFVA